MMGCVAVLIFTCLLRLSTAETGTLQIIGKTGQNYRGVITIPIKAPVQHGWGISLQFNEPIRILSSWKAKITHRSQLRYMLENKVFNSVLNTGTMLNINFQAKLFNIHRNPKAKVMLKRKAEERDCSQNTTVKIFERWPVAFKAKISLVAPVDVQEWKIHLTFSEKISLLQVPKATHVKINKTYFILTRASWDKTTLKQGGKLEIEFIAYVKGQLPRITALFAWKGTCMTTSQPSTPVSSTFMPSTHQSSTYVSSTRKPSTSTQSPSTYITSSQKPSTSISSTMPVSTSEPQTKQPSTSIPSTGQPSTQKPFTYVPSTGHSSTNAPSTYITHTHKPSTSIPSTMFVSTSEHSTRQPSTYLPETPSTFMPSTQKPVNYTKSTQKPVTYIPSTGQSSTYAPSTLSSSTYKLSTRTPVTSIPSTILVSTSEPSTRQPSTFLPSNGQPSTYIPSTRRPSTFIPWTQKPATYTPSTSEPSTAQPATNQPSTGQTSSYVPSTEQPSTYIPSTQRPSTFISSTQKPLTYITTPVPASSGQLSSTYIPSTDLVLTPKSSTYMPSTQETSSISSAVQASTNEPSTGQPPTYKFSTRKQSTTQKPSTSIPSTGPSPYITSTSVPSTKPLSTSEPTTGKTSTNITSTGQPSTYIPSTQQQSTYVPSNQRSSNQILSTQKPSSYIPSTQEQSTYTPSTQKPSISIPSSIPVSTFRSSTEQPSTAITSIRQQSTYIPSTHRTTSTTLLSTPTSTYLPSTQKPSTYLPSTSQPSTNVPSTEQLSSYRPSTEHPSTYIPSTWKSSSLHPSGQPSTYKSSTAQTSTDQPFTYSPSLAPTSPNDCDETPLSIDTRKKKISVLVVKDWPDGFKATMKMNISDDTVEGWEIRLFFDRRIKDLTVWRVVTPSVRSGTRFVLKNMPWNKVLETGTILEVSFLAFKTNTAAVPNMCAVFVWKRRSPLPSSLPTTHVTTNWLTSKAPSFSSPSSFSTKRPTIEISTKETTFPTSSTTYKPSLKYPYNYDEVLRKSILFYEAQRSGVLPPSNRISWRGNSAQEDRGENGEDLVGGWYDAGDHVKFGFPMAFSTTLLTWGLLEYRDAYLKSGQLEHMLDCIKWPLDYFIKAHVKSDVFYGQVTFIYQHLH